MASCCRLCLYENESGDEYFNVLSTNEISGLLPKIEKYLHIEVIFLILISALTYLS